MRIIERTRAFIIGTRKALTPSPAAWDGAAVGVILLTTAIAAFFLGSFVLPDFAWQKLPGYVASLGLLFGLGMLALWLLALLNRLGPLYRVAIFVFAPFVLLFFPIGEEPAAAAFGVAMLLTASLAGGGIGALRATRGQRRRWAVASLLFAAALLAGGLYAVFSEIDEPNPWLAEVMLEDRTLQLPNPALPGDHGVQTLTYGSGKDRRREFGSAVELVARSVDGSKLLDNWDGFSGWLRSSYWGFDAGALPLQARVWYPDGDGPFPLVLVVHGNHSMEDYSDPGYAYLGELFASRGIILASVDENFLNSSVSAWVDFFDDRPGLDEENDARGWLLLQHLAQWRDWNAEPGHPFAGKVDLERVALIGHSRGGEAVGIAAAFNALGHYPDDATLAFDFGFSLRGVIAIAPVDGQYKPREKPTPIRDVNYFTIHGSMDGDVQSFDGTAQYARVRFGDGADFGFRASLFVEGANHGQFNTTWEQFDTSTFRAWALDVDRIMPADDQREVARVYFSAFMEIVLRDRYEYLPMFADVRHAAAWLPKRYYISQYSDSRYRPIADFEEDIDPATTTLPGGRITTGGLSKWYEAANSIKYDDLDTHAAVFAWDERTGAGPAWVDLALAGNVPTAGAGSSLILSLSAADIGTLPDDWQSSESDDTNDDDDELPEGLDWSITLRDAAGNAAVLALSHDLPLYPQVRSIPRRATFLESDEPTEPLFRRFALPLAAFAEANPALDIASLRGIRFAFDRSPRGAIIVDDIGIAPAAAPMAARR